MHVGREGREGKNGPQILMGASSSRRIGWLMKISRALVQRNLISYSCSWTCLPGRLPRTAKEVDTRKVSKRSRGRNGVAGLEARSMCSDTTDCCYAVLLPAGTPAPTSIPPSLRHLGRAPFQFPAPAPLDRKRAVRSLYTRTVSPIAPECAGTLDRQTATRR